MKFFLWRNGFGGWSGYTEPFHAGDMALGEIGISVSLLAVGAILLYVANRMGSVLIIPFLFLAIGVLIFALLEPVFEPEAAFLVIQPLLLYGWACYCWGIYGATGAVSEEHFGMIGWLISGIVALVVCCFLADAMSVPVLLVPTCLQIAIWWTALMAMDSTGRAIATKGLKYMFRIAAIVAVVGVGIGLFSLAASAKNGRKGSVRSSGAAAAFSRTGDLIFLAYLVCLFAFLLAWADLSYLAPVEVFTDAIESLQASGPVQMIAAFAGIFFLWFAGVLSAFLSLVLDLVFRIFDASGPGVSVPAPIAAVASGVVLVVLMNVATGVVAKMLKKK